MKRLLRTILSDIRHALRRHQCDPEETLAALEEIKDSIDMKIGCLRQDIRQAEQKR